MTIAEMATSIDVTLQTGWSMMLAPPKRGVTIGTTGTSPLILEMAAGPRIEMVDVLTMVVGTPSMSSPL